MSILITKNILYKFTQGKNIILPLIGVKNSWYGIRHLDKDIG